MGDKGRTSKRTPELVGALLGYLAHGNTRKASCDMVGISDETLANWFRRDLDFLDSVKRAEADAIAERVSRIRQAGIGGAVIKRVTVAKATQDGQEIVTTTEEYTRPEWTADAWLLERRYPQDFGRKDALGVTYDLSQLTDEELEQFDQLSNKVIPISSARRRG